jgi:ribosomal protein L20
LITLVRKQILKRGSGVFGLVLGIRNDIHSHEMASNPFVYRKEHVKALPSYLPSVELARSLRSANILYSKAVRVLEQASFPLDRSTYYNIRERQISADSD